MSSYASNQSFSTPSSSRVGRPESRDLGESSPFVTPIHRQSVVVGEESMFTTPRQWNIQQDEELPFFNAVPEPPVTVAQAPSLPSTPSESEGPEAEAPQTASATQSKPRRDVETKINFMFDALKEVNWTLADFLHHLFRLPSSEPRRTVPPRTVRHGTVVGTYLSGGMKYTVAELVGFWLEDPTGRAKRGSADGEYELKYSPSVPWKGIKHAHTALTSMAIQLCESHLVREQRTAVRGVNGLHGSGIGARGHRQLSWEDISSHTFSQAQDIFSTHQPCTMHVVKRLATPAPRTDESGDLIRRKKRPPENVATEVISMLDFSHTMFARLLPAAQSVLWFGCKVERPIFNFTSRVGITQAWGTSYNLLARMADEASEALAELGRKWLEWLFTRGDNAQRGHKHREMRIGRENAMKIGFAVTAADAIDFDPDAADLDDHLRRLAQNLRAQLTCDSLRELVDWEHIEVAFELQWLQVLTNYIPSLAHFKPHVAKLFETEGAKLRVPLHKTRVRPMAPSAKNESITTELRDAIVDVLAQLGQTEDNFMRRLVPFGGDGLTFEKTVLLKRLLQFEDDEFKRLDIIYPFLETWHTQWTYLSLVYESHYGPLLTNDPSRLGHSAVKINQKRPSNLSKVDYYPALYSAYTVLDARMLDCWRLKVADENEDLFEHFEKLDEDQLPALETLRKYACELHNQYSTQRAWVLAFQGGGGAESAGWVAGEAWEHQSTATAATAPLEQPEPAAPATESSETAAGREDTKSSGSSSGSSSASRTESSIEEDSPPFSGDQSLAQSVLFMRDTMLSRDASHAVASGDVGRLWNDMKMMMYNFAGSSHSKYTTYLLEMICILELESSPLLRETFLRNWLINPSGEPGRNIEGDLYQEHLNRELEDAIGRGGSEWDSRFVRKVIAPNVQRFIDLKNEWGTGVGLSERRGRHPVPHSRPEIRTLLATYKAEGLHTFRSGRAYTASSTPNTFRDGVVNLEKDKLAKFVSDTTRVRVSQMPADASIVGSHLQDIDALIRAAEEEDEDEDLDELDESEEEEEDPGGPMHGRVEIEDGELIITLTDEETQSASEWVQVGEAEDNEAGILFDEENIVEGEIDDYEDV